MIPPKKTYAEIMEDLNNTTEKFKQSPLHKRLVMRAEMIRESDSSLSAINSFFRDNYQRLINKWNEIRNDENIDIERIPNYRAINRIL